MYLSITRSVRKRLDFEKPVPRDVLLECLELAIQASTGSNQQGWQWVFVEDPEKKAHRTRTRRSCPVEAFWTYSGGHGHRVHDARPRHPRAAVHAARASHRRRGQPRRAHGSRACRHLHL